MIIDYIKLIFKSRNLRNSSVVVCNSVFTRDTAAHWYNFNVAKSVIGYCGVDNKFFELSAEFRKGIKDKRFNLSDFILTFATGDARENYNLLPELLSKLRLNGCNSKLIIAGVEEDGEYVKLMENRLMKLGMQSGIDYQLIGFIGEERLNDLVELYTEADFYLELSGHEGFGMQLAEAMACGTTCISSGNGALTEVGAGFDLRISLLDIDQIAKTITNSYMDKKHLRDNNRQINYVRTHYTWDAVADLVVDKILSLNAQADK